MGGGYRHLGQGSIDAGTGSDPGTCSVDLVQKLIAGHTAEIIHRPARG